MRVQLGDEVVAEVRGTLVGVNMVGSKVMGRVSNVWKDGASGIQIEDSAFVELKMIKREQQEVEDKGVNSET